MHFANAPGFLGSWTSDVIGTVGTFPAEITFMMAAASSRSVAFKGGFCPSRGGFTDPVCSLLQRPPPRVGCAAVPQIRCILQPQEMGRGLCGCQGMSPVGPNLWEGMVTAGGCCLLPTLIFKMEMPGGASHSALGDSGRCPEGTRVGEE